MPAGDVKRHIDLLEGRGNAAARVPVTALDQEFPGGAACGQTGPLPSPVDVRGLNLSQLAPDPAGPLFSLARTKTGKAAIGSLGHKTKKILAGYIAALPFTRHPEMPIFHTRGGDAGPKGGRPRPSTKDTLAKDFASCAKPHSPATGGRSATSVAPA